MELDELEIGPPAPIDPLAYRKAIGRFATGITIVTAAHDGKRYGMTANSLTSVSLDPVLLLVCFMHDSDTGVAVRESRRFAVNVLDAETGIELAKRFARKLQPDEEDQLEGIEVREGPHGLPLMRGVAHFICNVEQVLRAGDHDIVLGAVEQFGGPDVDVEPVIFFAGKYWRLTPLS